MYLIRLYKDYNTNKPVGAKIVDEKTLECIELPWDELRQAVKTGAIAVNNLEIDRFDRLRLKNMNPSKKVKYYRQQYVDNLTINQYCIILGSNVGKVRYIADTNDGVNYGENATLGEIASTLGISDIGDIKFFNGYVKEEMKGNYGVYKYNGNCYRKLQSLTNNVNIKAIINDEWGYSVIGVGQDGIRLRKLEHINGAGEACVPEGISYIGRFGGGVNNLTFPISVKRLGEGCFEDLEDIRSIMFGRGIKEIPSECCLNSSIKRVKFSGAEEVIGDNAFRESDLCGSVITNALKIGKHAFSSTNIKFVSTLSAKFIDSCAFEYNYKLEKAKLGSNLEVLGPGAFRGCDRLSEVEIPRTTKVIGKHAFKDCKRLKEVRVPYSTKIEDGAFPKKCKIVRY